MKLSIKNMFLVVALSVGSFVLQDVDATRCLPSCYDPYPINFKLAISSDCDIPNGGCKLDDGKVGTCQGYTCADTGTICECVEETTPSPASTPSNPPGGKNDPHITTWSGKTYDYTGFCDVVLLNSPKFQNNLGLRVHIRTRECDGPLCPNRSKISNAAVQIGKDVFEVEGPRSTMKHYLNGKQLRNLPSDTNEEAVVGETEGAYHLAGGLFSVTTDDHWGTQYKYSFYIDLGKGTEFLIEVWEDFVNVSFKNVKFEDFEGSMGMMGQYPSGMWMGRDGITTFDDPLEFGQEWQVLESEPMLFHDTTSAPQAPQKCDAAKNLVVAKPAAFSTSGTASSFRGL